MPAQGWVDEPPEDGGPVNETRGKALGLAKLDVSDGEDIMTALRNVRLAHSSSLSLSLIIGAR